MSRGLVERFSSVIERADVGGAFVSVPFDVELVFGKKRVPVSVMIDGEPYRGSLARMGGAAHVLLVPKRVRERIGKGPGDAVDIAVEEDLRPRAVAVPGDFRRALEGHPKARRLFHGLSRTGRKEYVRWIQAPKRAETRAGRVARAIAMLGQGKRAP
ncbi:MAG: YdeI/OmpD-associated family protein [Opitutaceae bacterium]|jgi:hypothetical protein